MKCYSVWFMSKLCEPWSIPTTSACLHNILVHARHHYACAWVPLFGHDMYIIANNSSCRCNGSRQAKSVIQEPLRVSRALYNLMLRKVTKERVVSMHGNLHLVDYVTFHFLADRMVMTLPTPCILTTKAQFTKQIDFTRTKFTCQVTKHLYLPTILTPGPIVVKSLFSGIQKKIQFLECLRIKLTLEEQQLTAFCCNGIKSRTYQSHCCPQFCY